MRIWENVKLALFAIGLFLAGLLILAAVIGSIILPFAIAISALKYVGLV